MKKRTTVKGLCIALFLTVLLLAALLTVGVYTGLFDDILGQSLGYIPKNKDYLTDILSSTPDFTLPSGSVPRPTGPVTEIPGIGGIGGGIGSGGDVGGFGDLQKNTLVLKVTAEETATVYLKYASFLDFSGQSWSQAAASDIRIDGGSLSADYLRCYTTAVPEQYLLRIDPVAGVHVLPCYMYPDGEITESDVSITGSGTDVYMASYIHDSGRYVESLTNQIWSNEITYREYVYGYYLNVDTETYLYMKDLIARNGWSREQVGIVETVAAYIQNAAVYNLNYDRGLDAEANGVIAFLETYKEGKCSHYASAATLLFRALGIPARYTVGYVANTKAGTETEVLGANAHAWVEVYEDGLGWRLVEVTGGSGGEDIPDDGEKPDDGEGSGGMGLSVRLWPATLRKQYDGTPLTHTGELYGFTELASAGYTYEAAVSGSRVDYGYATTKITSLRIYDPDGKLIYDLENGIAEGIRVELSGNKMQVYWEELDFTSGSITKVYDGTPLRLEAYQCELINTIALPKGYTYVITPSAERTDVGISAATYAVQIFDEQGIDRSDWFYLDRTVGRLTVTPARLVLQADSATKEYDGTALTAQSYTVIQGGEMESWGDYIGYIVIEGSQTGPGKSDNIITDVVIYDQNGRDVTGNYTVVFVAGTLRVIYVP